MNNEAMILLTDKKLKAIILNKDAEEKTREDALEELLTRAFIRGQESRDSWL
jgi:hypothetical protein